MGYFLLVFRIIFLSLFHLLFSQVLLPLKRVTTLSVLTALHDVNFSLCQSSHSAVELSSFPKSPHSPDSCLVLSCIDADLLRPFLSSLSRRSNRR